MTPEEEKNETDAVQTPPEEPKQTANPEPPQQMDPPPKDEKSRSRPVKVYLTVMFCVALLRAMAAGKNFLDCLNPNSLEVLTGAKVEASLAEAQPTDRFQFLRQGYFCADSKDSAPGHLVFNRAVSLKDSFKA